MNKITDPDLDILRESLPSTELDIHDDRIAQLHGEIAKFIGNVQKKANARAHTVGIFGPWGSGKTTLLAQLQQKLRTDPQTCDATLVYYNAWKYSNATDLVPAFVYKLLRYGFRVDPTNSQVIGGMLFALGSKYADSLGSWAKQFLGLNPVEVVKDLANLKEQVEKAQDPLGEIADEYYCRVNRVRDMLLNVASDFDGAVVAMIDEIDRCDPDEAFAMFKELRIFFSMRGLPLYIIIAANPDPIGLAIRHKYGLNTCASDYEARRILEKFVDQYVDLSETVYLGDFVRQILLKATIKPPTVSFAAAIDEHVRADLFDNVIYNSTQFDAITSRNPFYANLRVVQKTLAVACLDDSQRPWTRWHLDLASQLDDGFRRKLAAVASHIRDATECAYRDVRRLSIRRVNQGGQAALALPDEVPERTVFAYLRSRLWENMRAVIVNAGKFDSPDARRAQTIVGGFVEDYRLMDFIANMAMLRFEDKISLGQGNIGDWLDEGHITDVVGQFGWLLANY